MEKTFDTAISTGGNVWRMLAVGILAPEVIGKGGMFLDVSPLDAPDLVPAGATYNWGKGCTTVAFAREPIILP